MIRIKCVGCGQKFTWDETQVVEPGGGLSTANDPQAKSYLVPCSDPKCGADNKIYLRGLKRPDRTIRGVQDEYE